ncbi:hypothetical protein V8E36_008888 [Tilletia maclaganii]
MSAKRALVLGGSCEIGASVSTLLAESGYNVTATYHANKKSADELAKQHERISIKQLDLTGSKAALEAFAAEVVQEHNGKSPEVLIFCSAAIKPVAFGEIEETAFDSHYNSIVRGPLLLIQAFGPTLVEGTRILLFSSALARSSSIFDDRFAVYASAKSASEQLVKYLSKTLAPKGVTINAVAPGPIDTTGLRYHSSGKSNVSVADGDASVARLAQFSPAKRIGRPEEVAHVVKFLTSPEASWVSGAILNVSGGMNVYG